jgi:hypothetical protein
MRRVVLSVTVLSVAASLGVLASGAGAAGRVPTTRVVPCVGSPEAKPGKFVLACGDGNWYLTSLKWVRWTANVGIAKGTDNLNDCTPDCADGRFHSTSTVAVFSDPVRRGSLGELFAVATVVDSSRLPGSNGTVTEQRLQLRVVQ